MTKVFEAKNHILIDTDVLNPQLHRHNAAHILISKEADMTVTCDNKTIICRGVLIPSHKSHKINTHGVSALVFLYDNATRVAKQITDMVSISEETCDEIVTNYSRFVENRESYSTFEESVLALAGLSINCCLQDCRIDSAISFIRSHLSEKLTCQAVAKSVCLSESRFSHLLKEQVGMTFPAYVLYQRMMYAYIDILCGKSITEAALDAGFSSSGHFADVHRRVFGLSASSVLENMVFVKIS